MLRSLTVFLAMLCIIAQSYAQTPHLNTNSYILVDPSSGFTLTINPGTLTGNRILTFPNVSGTLMTNPNNGTFPNQTGNAGKFLTTDGSILSWATAGGGGLVNFTESVNTTSPNATVPVVQLLATNAATDVDVALTPKGAGALTAQVADNTAAGGNKRGQYAVDWQMYRGVNTQVASGSYATVGGGISNQASGLNATVGGGTTNTASVSRTTVGGGDGNTASAFYATVGGGFKNVANSSEATVGGGGINTASGNSSMVGGGFGNIASSNYGTVGGGSNNTASSADNATVGGGNTNTSSGYSSVVGGGYSNWASAWSSTVGGGYTNTASALYSSIPGGYQALASNYGQMAQGSGEFATQGDAQTSVFVLRNQTTTAAATSLFLDGSGLRIAIPTKGAMTFKVTIVGKITGQTATVGGWEIIGAISNNGVGTTAIIGANITRTINTPAGWGVPTVGVNGQNMDIQVTGAAATTIDWVARVETVEVVF